MTPKLLDWRDIRIQKTFELRTIQLKSLHELLHGGLFLI
jgi:hypothetical protein